MINGKQIYAANNKWDNKKVTGYTVEEGMVVAWDDKKHKNQGFVKYVSHPFWKSTTGDPYDDFAKVTGQVNGEILVDALHPLVAACPEVGIEMEKIVLSKNEHVTRHIGQTTTSHTAHTISTTTSNSHQDVKIINFDVGGGYTLKSGVKFSVSGSYSEKSSNTISVDKGEETSTSAGNAENWTTTLNLNKSETAYLNGNVRYINVGTAPIYNVKPTLNFILGRNENAATIATVTAKRNAVAHVLFPNKTYPLKTQNAIAFNTNDDFDSRPIFLNYDQVEKIDNGEVLTIEITQTLGLASSNGDERIGLSFQYAWEQILPIIYNRTACITMIFKDGSIAKRRVAARKADNYAQQYQPELTIGQAIELAFYGAKFNYQTSTLTYQDYDYAPHIIIDSKTQQLIKQQQTQQKNGEIFDFNLKLMQGMNILVIPQYSNQTLLKLIAQFLTSYDQNHRFNLINTFVNNNWIEVENLIKMKLRKKLGQNDFERIKNLQIINSYKSIVQDVDNNHNDWKNIEFTVGNEPPKLVKIYFKNIFTDKVLVQKVSDFLKQFNRNHQFDLSEVMDISKPWTTILANIKKVITFKFSAAIAKRINLEMENAQIPIEKNANDLGQDQQKIRVFIKNYQSPWIVMHFKNIKIQPIPKQFDVDNNLLANLSAHASGDTWGKWEIHDSYSQKVKILHFNDYRQKNYQEFAKKYPKITIEFDSYINHWQGPNPREVVKKITYKFEQLFQKNGTEITTTISNLYLGDNKREFLTGGTHGYTQIHTSVKDNQLLIITSAHAGGGGNSGWKNYEEAIIKIKKITFYA